MILILDCACQVITRHSVASGERLPRRLPARREMLALRLNSSDHLPLATVCCDCLREPIVSRNDLARDIEKVSRNWHV